MGEGNPIFSLSAPELKRDREKGKDHRGIGGALLLYWEVVQGKINHLRENS